MKKRIVKFNKAIVNFYNTWYGIINAIIGFLILSNIQNTMLLILVIAVCLIDFYTWFKNVWKNLGTKTDLFSTISQNNALCVYGGIGSGKSTLANFIVHYKRPKDLIYYNTKNKGYKTFTNKHLLCIEPLEQGCGVIVDESGAEADAYHYGKEDAKVRKRIDYLNKFFRQWYGDNSLLIYIDQCQSNQNTSLYKNIYYVIQTKGVEVKPASIIPYLLCKFILMFVNKNRLTKINNPFSNVCLSYMEFLKMGDYAEHYTRVIQDKDDKKLVCPIYSLFGGFNTYVFREFNPTKDKPVDPYIWGTDERIDNEIMKANFNFKDIHKELDSSFIDIDY